MGRTSLMVKMVGGREAAEATTRKILQANSYKEIQYGEEIVWKMGTGMLTSMHYIKVEFPNDTDMILKGWIQNGVGSVGGKEHELTGITAQIPKKSVKKTMDTIKIYVENQYEV